METVITITWREVVLVSALMVLVYLGGMLVGMIRARERASGGDSSLEECRKLHVELDELRDRVAAMDKAPGHREEDPSTGEESLYIHAQRLMQEGFRADEVADRLALSRAEIDLLAALQREQGKRASLTDTV